MYFHVWLHVNGQYRRGDVQNVQSGGSPGPKMRTPVLHSTLNLDFLKITDYIENG